MAWGNSGSDADTTEASKFANLFKPSTDLELSDGLKLGVYGKSKTGKTTLSQTAVLIRGELSPVYIIDTEGNAKKGSKLLPLEQQEKIFIAEVIKYIKPKPGETNKKVKKIDLISSLDAAYAAMDQIIEVINNTECIEGQGAPGTIVIDSASDIWIWLGTWLEHGAPGASKKVKKTKGGATPRYEWGIANERYQEFIYLLLDSGWHVIMTFRAHDAISKKGEDLGYVLPKWQKNTDFWIDCETELQYDGVNYNLIFRGDRYGNMKGKIQNATFTDLLDHIEKESGARIL